MSGGASVHREVGVDDGVVNDIKQEVNGLDFAPMPMLATTDNGKARKRKERSKCWTQFDKLPVGEDGTKLCRCKCCLKTFTCGSEGGTGHLLRHMEKCAKRDTPDPERQARDAGRDVGDVGERDTRDVKRERSECWTQFEKLPVGKDGKKLCRCKHCPKTFTCRSDGRTGHLLCHMKKCLKSGRREAGQMLLSFAPASINRQPQQPL